LVVACLAFTVAFAQSTVYVTSVRWGDGIDPFYVDVVLSTIDSAGKQTDLGNFLCTLVSLILMIDW